MVGELNSLNLPNQRILSYSQPLLEFEKLTPSLSWTGKHICCRVLMSPIRNTELVVIIFDVKPEQEQETKKKRKLSRINLLLRPKTSKKQEKAATETNRKHPPSADVKKKEPLHVSSSDNQPNRKSSILSQLCSKKTSSKSLKFILSLSYNVATFSGNRKSFGFSNSIGVTSIRWHL